MNSDEGMMRVVCGEFKCICCDCVLEAEPSDNPMATYPIYDGLIFRATGNYGSTVFDPMSFLPGRKEEILQVIICDDCIKKKADQVTRIYNIRREATAESEEFTL